MSVSKTLQEQIANFVGLAGATCVVSEFKGTPLMSVIMNGEQPWESKCKINLNIMKSTKNSPIQTKLDWRIAKDLRRELGLPTPVYTKPAVSAPETPVVEPVEVACA